MKIKKVNLPWMNKRDSNFEPLFLYNNKIICFLYENNIKNIERKFYIKESNGSVKFLTKNHKPTPVFNINGIDYYNVFYHYYIQQLDSYENINNITDFVFEVNGQYGTANRLTGDVIISPKNYKKLLCLSAVSNEYIVQNDKSFGLVNRQLEETETLTIKDGKTNSLISPYFSEALANSGYGIFDNDGNLVHFESEQFSVSRSKRHFYCALDTKRDKPLYSVLNIADYHAVILNSSDKPLITVDESPLWYNHALVLKKNRYYGVLLFSGKLLADVTLNKKQAMDLIDSLNVEEKYVKPQNKSEIDDLIDLVEIGNSYLVYEEIEGYSKLNNIIKNDFSVNWDVTPAPLVIPKPNEKDSLYSKYLDYKTKR